MRLDRILVRVAVVVVLSAEAAHFLLEKLSFFPFGECDLIITISKTPKSNNTKRSCAAASVESQGVALFEVAPLS